MAEELNSAKKAWETYRDAEFPRAREALVRMGYWLPDVQPHLSGERYLLSGKKLVLLATRIKDGAQVVAKVSSDAKGRKEIEREHECRTTLHALSFAYFPFHSPQEYEYRVEDGCRIVVTEFIAEEQGFLTRPFEEQFFLALGALKTQEGVQATTYAHTRTVKGVFGMESVDTYLKAFDEYTKSAITDEVRHAMQNARDFLTKERQQIERYSGFLTHTDFVPHNFRIKEKQLYLLDHTSLAFGNKYESWARLMNYMVLYNRQLELALHDYVRLNRTPEELTTLRAMRAYKLGFLIAFYIAELAKTNGDLRALAEARIAFWAEVLEGIVSDTPVSDARIAAYKEARDRLRSPEEKERQKALNQL
jgi:hypothetical protein